MRRWQQSICIRTVRILDLVVDKREVDRLIDLAQKVVRENECFDANELQLD